MSTYLKGTVSPDPTLRWDAPEWLPPRHVAIIENRDKPGVWPEKYAREWIGPFDYGTTIVMAERPRVRVKAYRVPDEAFPGLIRHK
jgi:hypothetical protein